MAIQMGSLRLNLLMVLDIKIMFEQRRCGLLKTIMYVAFVPTFTIPKQQDISSFCMKMIV